MTNTLERMHAVWFMRDTMEDLTSFSLGKVQAVRDNKDVLISISSHFAHLDRYADKQTNYNVLHSLS